MSYQEWYERVRGFFLRHPFGLLSLRVYNRLMTILFPLVFAGLLYLASWEWRLIYLGLSATGFLLLSLFRRWINRPRPYETYTLMPLFDKDSLGESFPSRHVFSATLISMLALHSFGWLGMVFLALSAGLALTRVLGGVHFPRDVAVGYLLGVLWGSLLYFI